MLPEKLSTDLTSLNEDEDRLALVIEMTVDDDGDVAKRRRSTARASTTTPSSPTTPSPRGSTASGPTPDKARRRCRGLDEKLRLQDARRADACASAAHEQGALDLETIEARAVIDDGKVVDLRPSSARTRAGADRGLHDRRERRRPRASSRRRARRRSAACVRSPERWDRIETHRRRSSASGCRPSRTRRRSRSSCVARREADPMRFPDLSLSIVKAMGAGEYVVERPGEASDGPLRPRGEGLHALDRAEPPLSRPHHAAPR